MAPKPTHQLEAGQTWVPRAGKGKRAGSRRILTSKGNDPDGYPVVYWEDPYGERGVIRASGFRNWIRKHQAECSPCSDPQP